MTNSPPADQPQKQPTQSEGGPPPAPRWVKIILIIVLVVALLAAFIIVNGIGGEHGPGRHNPGSFLPALQAQLTCIHLHGPSLL